MRRLTFIAYAITLTLCSCLFHKKVLLPHSPDAAAGIKTDTTILHDAARARDIPVAFYTAKETSRKHQPVVLFSHGYGQNRGGDYLQYTYLTGHLAAKGFFVVSIQHELATDSLMPATGIPQVVRRSNWERGAANIRFVLDYLKRAYPGLDYKQVTVIGHSNGGDMSMLFAEKYPALIANVISLDNRRMALPRSRKPRVFSLRSSDQPADEGVLPDEQERKRFGITIIKLPDTPHNNMDNDANEAQRKEIEDYIDSFLSIKS